jgi:hypothetical protein
MDLKSGTLIIKNISGPVPTFMNTKEKLAFKNTLKAACKRIIGQRIASLRMAVAQAQLAANQEEKSSAGDKHETSRAMGHLEQELQSSQLAAHLKELGSLHGVNTDVIYATPVAGSVVRCTNVCFFIGCGLGKQVVEGVSIVFLSAHAPLARSLILKKAGESLVFNGEQNYITEVF